MFRRLGTYTTGAVNQAWSFNKFSSFPRFAKLKQIWLRFSYPINNGNGGATPVTPLELLAACLGTTTLQYGSEREHTPYPNVPAADFETIHRLATRIPLPNSLPGAGVPVGASTQTIDLCIPACLLPLLDGILRAPGTSQCRTIYMEGTEGTDAGLPVGVTRGAGDMVVDVDVDCDPTSDDDWHPFLSYFRGNEDSLSIDGPDGLILAAWDNNASQAATLINLYSLRVGNLAVATAIPLYIPGDDYSANWAVAGENITDTVTVLCGPNENRKTVDMPVGPLVFEQADQYVPQLQLRVLYIPNMTGGMSEMAALAGANNAKKPVVFQTPAVAENGPTRWAATIGGRFVPPKDPAFLLRAGILAEPGAAVPTLSIPEIVSKQEQAAAKFAEAAGGDADKVAVAKNFRKRVSKGIPGGARAGQMPAGSKNAGGLLGKISGGFAKLFRG